MKGLKERWNTNIGKNKSNQLALIFSTVWIIFVVILFEASKPTLVSYLATSMMVFGFTIITIYSAKWALKKRNI